MSTDNFRGQSGTYMAKRTDWIAQLAELDSEDKRAAFLAGRPDLLKREAMAELSEEVLRYARQDLELAERLAMGGRWLAHTMGDDYCHALAFKALGNVRYLAGSYGEALDFYRSAVDLFEKENAEVDAAITLSSSIQTRSYLGRYNEAFKAIEKARGIFERHGETLHLARLKSNEANIYTRQDRLEEAVSCYDHVLEIFREEGDPQDVAAALYNIAVCRIGLNDFKAALSRYRELSSHCDQHDMRLIGLRADYNIAYLHFLRGEYTPAIELYQKTRQLCREVDDLYHLALCDLDQAEIYLELNMTSDGERMARRAFQSFKDLRMGYEAAKAQAFQAIAASQRREASEALKTFDLARERFEKEGNRVWMATIDLYQSLILASEDRLEEARDLARRALEFFLESQQFGKVVLCELQLARVDLACDQLEEARNACLSSLERLKALDMPALTSKAFFILGQVEEARGERQEAAQAYRRAHAMLEHLRCHLRGEDLKIAFLKDKLQIYESLFWLAIEGESGSGEDQLEAFKYVEQAKSRSLADLIAFRLQSLPTPATAPINPAYLELVERMRELREELNWCYRQIHLHELRRNPEGGEYQRQPTNASKDSKRQPSLSGRRESTRIEDLRERSRECEVHLLEIFSELRNQDAEFNSLQTAETLELGAVRSALPGDTLLIEYYEARGDIYACLIDQERLEIVRLAASSKVQEIQRFLQFQLSKFQLGTQYVEVFGEAVHRAMLHHLEALHSELFAPLQSHFSERERSSKPKIEQLVVIPHGTLHYVPFHALFDGEFFLIDKFSVCYAPSASVFAICCSKPPVRRNQALVLGIPDSLTPFIAEEVQAVAATLPEARVFLGEEATEKRLRSLGPRSRLIHIATHGFFRQDNPMFSAIQLGDSRLTLFDLYHLELDSDLVVLSGCATGLNVVESGDELMGLTRGLLYAGARSALVTLWDVHDQSTAEFMRVLYRHLEKSGNRAEAVRQAMLEIRRIHPSPYYWAPFVLIGKPFSSF